MDGLYGSQAQTESYVNSSLLAAGGGSDGSVSVEGGSVLPRFSTPPSPHNSYNTINNHNDQSAQSVTQKSLLGRCFSRAMKGKLNVTVCLLITFVSDVSYSVVIPSMFPYTMDKGGNEYYYGIIIASWSFGRIISALVLGWAASHFSYKAMLIVSLLLSISGDIVYTLANNHWLILVGRLMNGLGSGSKGVIQSYLTEMSSPDDKKIITTNLGLSSILAFGLGPGLVALLGFVPSSEYFNLFIINQYNMPSLCCALLSYYALIICAIFFVEKPTKAKEDFLERLEYDVDVPFRSTAMIGLSVIVFLMYPSLIVYETLSTPITMKNYDWSVNSNAYLWMGIAVGFGITFFSLQFLSKQGVPEYIIALVNLLGLLCSMIFLINPYGGISLWRYIVGTALLVFSFPMADVVISSLFSQVISGGKPGYYVALFSASGSVSKILAPLWSTTIFSAFDQSEFWVFVTTGSLIAGAVIIYIVILWHLRRLLNLLNLSQKSSQNIFAPTSDEESFPSSVQYGSSKLYKGNDKVVFN